ncbi:MAG: biotin-dependent carboxyltransferase family protein [Acidobacteria bacterium]|nr:biotin-dependent carboxyltransferase family protein [Acidobacteriota bacterium]
MSGGFEVIRPGPLTTVQDLGRPGHAHLGVPRAGAADRDSLRLANRLVGNPEDAAGLECTLSGPALRFGEAAVVAVTGAEVPVTVDGEPLETNAALDIPAGGVLDVGTTTAGLRPYVAIRGGTEAEPVLGSLSRDTLSGLGPEPLAAGDRFAIGEPQGPRPGISVAPVAEPAAVATLRITPGPRADWFGAEAYELLTASPWEVANESNRSGTRLDGPALPRLIEEELRSEGLVEGAIQVRHSGLPMIMLADHPTTGGYPVIAVVIGEDIPAAAQARPGQVVRFRAA